MECVNCKEEFDPTNSFISDVEDAEFFNQWFDKPEKVCGPCGEQLIDNCKVLLK
jgi:hypothetical protein